MTTFYTFHNIHYTGQNLSLKVLFDPSHPVFAGHFPGQPVVPGVFLVEIAVSAGSAVLKKQMKAREISHIKFLQAIDPSNYPSVFLEGTIQDEGSGIYRIDATIFRDEMLFTKIKGLKIF